MTATKKIKIVIVPAERAEPMRVEEIIPDLAHLRAVLGGGYLENVAISSQVGEWHAYCDDEGKLKGLPINIRATAMARELGWPPGDVLSGTIMFLGNGRDGDEANVPDKVLRLARLDRLPDPPKSKQGCEHQLEEVMLRSETGERTVRTGRYVCTLCTEEIKQP